MTKKRELTKKEASNAQKEHGLPISPGRRKLPVDVRVLQNLHGEAIANMIYKLWEMDVEDIKIIWKDPKSPVLAASLASICYKAIQGSDKAMNLLLDRSVGKVKEKREVTFNVEGMTDQELVLIGRQAAQILEGEVIDDKEDDPII